MTDLFFNDLPPIMQAKIAQDLATIHDIDYNIAFKALQHINAMIDSDRKVTAGSFYLVAGFIFASITNTQDPAVLPRVWKKQASIMQEWHNYKNN